MSSEAQLAAVEKKIGYVFRNKSLLLTALTHQSYANEHACESNERLEFLGDSILNFVVADRLYRKSDAAEGELTQQRARLVSRGPLAACVERLGLLSAYRLGRGAKNERKELLSDKFKSNVYEAVVGAMYLDSGTLDTPREFVLRSLIQATAAVPPKDAKTAVQEWLQQRKLEWRYHTTPGAEGFCSVLTVGDQTYTGTGRKKREAEQAAARAAYAELTCEKPGALV